MTFSTLCNLLMMNDEDRFCEAYVIEREKFSCTDAKAGEIKNFQKNNHLLLRIACDMGLKKATAAMLTNLNEELYLCNGVLKSVIRNGDKEMLQILLMKSCQMRPKTRSKSKHTILHTFTKYYRNEKKFDECLKILLEWFDREKRHSERKICSMGFRDINEQDSWGNTALHFAALNYPEKLVGPLLDRGASLAVKNNKGETPMKWMPENVLKTYMDSLITEENQRIRFHEQYTINFNYKFLLNSVRGKHSYEETKSLIAMIEESSMNKLLTHPVLESFIYLKWQKISVLYMAYLLIFATFCMLFSGYIIFGYRNSIVSLTSLLGLRIVIFVFICFLLAIELVQFTTNPNIYVTNFEHSLNIAQHVLCTLSLVFDCSRNIGGTLGFICPQISSIAVLLTWINLLILIGKHPHFSIQIELLKVVSINYLKFFGWYILLIIGYSLSFFVLFRNCEGECSQTNPFFDLGTSFLKTSVMLTGEFDASDIPFLAFYGTSQIIFISFVMIMSIVLLNLLNGLAVADTSEIRCDAKIWTCMARIKIVYFLELFQSTFPVRKIRQSRNKKLLPIIKKLSVSLRAFIGSSGNLLIQPNKHVCMADVGGNRFNKKAQHHFDNPEIIKAAWKVLDLKKQVNDSQENFRESTAQDVAALKTLESKLFTEIKLLTKIEKENILLHDYD